MPAGVPAPSPGLSIARLRGGMLWLTGFAGAFAFIEPSPYEVASLVTFVVFAATGLSLRPGILPLAIMLGLYNLGFSLAAAQVVAPQTATWVLVSWYLAATALLFAAALAEDTQRRLSLLLRGTMLAAIVAALAAILGYARLVPELSELFLRYGRARGTFNDPNVLGAFLVFPLLLAVGRVFTGRGTVRACALIALFAAALLLSFSRGAWGQAAFAVVLMTLLSFLTGRSGHVRVRIVLFAAFGAIVLVALLVLLLSLDSVAALFRERASLEQSYDLGEFGRFGRHELGALLALDRPLGLGPLQFHMLFVEDPHNAFLNAFMSGGWLSGVAYLGLMLVTLCLGLRYAFVPTPWQPAYLAAYCAFAGTFGESLVIDSDHWRHFFLLVGVLWGLMTASRPYLAPRAAAPSWRSGSARHRPCTPNAGGAI
jgi:hypothetical protein